MLTSITIKNYKSIVDLTLELGRFNLFIGENGGGKSNILEALAMIAANTSNRLTNEDLIARGVRIARPTLTVNAFSGHKQAEEVSLRWKLLDGVENSSELVWKNGRWFDSEAEANAQKLLNDPRIVKAQRRWFQEGQIARLQKTEEGQEFLNTLEKIIEERMEKILVQVLSTTPEQMRSIQESWRLFEHYGIYCASTLALRGLQVESHREPLGLFGEGLDVAISQLPEKQRAQLLEYAKMVSWLGEIDIDQSGARNIEGYKPSRSRSNLYFIDKFLAKDNQIFSAENANEGILHILFHLVLFLHPETPKLFAIDNLETALNPHLLRNLVKSLAQLAKDPALDRQVLVTTHNPAALDGLNLFDDDQRLFVVSRNEEGHTQAQRIRLKPSSPSSEPKLQLKLSELWMRGLLGGIPTHF
jgi:predicted ATPase